MHKDNINIMLKKRELFWSYSEMDKKFVKTNDSMLSSIDYQIKAMSYSNWILTVQLCVNMFLTGQPQYTTFTFNKASLYYTFCQQSLMFFYFVPIMYCTRYIYGIFFTELTIQYKLLNESFQRTRNLEDMKKNIEHNVLLVR